MKDKKNADLELNLNRITVYEEALYPETFPTYKEIALGLIRLKKLYLSEAEVLEQTQEKKIEKVLEQYPHIFKTTSRKKNKNNEYKTVTEYIDLSIQYDIQPEDFCYDTFFAHRLRQIDVLKIDSFLNYHLSTYYPEKTNEFIYDKYHNTQINAVTEIVNSSGNISPNTQTISYTSFKKAKTIQELDINNNLAPINELDYTYGPDQQRKKADLLDATGNLLSSTFYQNNYERIQHGTNSNDFTETTYITATDGLCAIFVNDESGLENGKLYFVFTDHLGSILKLTHEDGTLAYEQSFDTWGKPRDPVTWDNNPASLPSPPEGVIRGFTGHEHLPQFSLINMNGRMYDPITARMLSVDNDVTHTDDPQNYNRYSYCCNNPLKYTDPTGNEVMWSYDGQDDWNDARFNNPLYAMFGGDPFGGGLDDMPDFNNNETETVNSSSSYIMLEYGEKSSSAIIDAMRESNIPSFDPTKGGLIDNYDDFIKFMKYQALNNPVEVAAWQISDSWSGNTSYVIQPWDENDQTTSKNNRMTVMQYGYVPENDIEAQWHTHPYGTISSPSYDDAYNSNSIWKMPVHVIDANGTIWNTYQYPSDYIIFKPLSKYTSYGYH